MNEFLIEAKLENMDAVQDFISAHIEDCPPKIQRQIGIAVDEVFPNIASYAYNPATGGAAVRIAVDSSITIEFEDSGIGRSRRELKKHFAHDAHLPIQWFIYTNDMTNSQ